MAEPKTAPVAEPVKLPTSDTDFVFKDINSAPSWVDKGWAGYSHGPALALPANLLGEGPYTTITAEVGDTVFFKAAKGAQPAHFEVIKGDASLDEGLVTRKPPQASGASLEDLIKLGLVTLDDLGADAKAQVAERSPRLRDMMEGKVPLPESDEKLALLSPD